MPGDKSTYNNNFVTEVTAYRTNISEADAEPPVDIECIEFPQGGPGSTGKGANASCRIGASNILFVYLLLDGAGMTITPRLWRIIRGIPYECTPASWAAVNQSSMLTALNLPAGSYTVTVTGTFNGNLVHIAEQHTE